MSNALQQPHATQVHSFVTMDRKDLPKNPIGAHVFFNVIITVLVLASLGVSYVWMGMRNQGTGKELKKIQASIETLEAEIELLKVDMDKAQENGRLAVMLEKLSGNVDLRDIDSAVELPMPKLATR